MPRAPISSTRIPGLRRRLQHRVRVAELVVERPGRRDHRARAGTAAGRCSPWSWSCRTSRSARPRSAGAAGRAPRGRAGPGPAAGRRRPRPAAPVSRVPSTAAAPGGDRGGGVVVAVDLLALERHEQAARADLRESYSTAPVTTAAGSASTRVPPVTAAISSSVIRITVTSGALSSDGADNRDPFGTAAASSASRSSIRSSNGSTSPFTSWPRSCPLPSTAITSPGPASRTASSIAARRPATSMIFAAAPAPSAPARTAARISAGSSVRGIVVGDDHQVGAARSGRAHQRPLAACPGRRRRRSRRSAGRRGRWPARAARPARPRSRPACGRSRPRPRISPGASTRSSRPGTPAQAATPRAAAVGGSPRPPTSAARASSALATLCRPGRATPASTRVRPGRWP